MICPYCGRETWPLNYHEGREDCDMAEAREQAQGCYCRQAPPGYSCNACVSAVIEAKNALVRENNELRAAVASLKPSDEVRALQHCKSIVWAADATIAVPPLE